ncbi:MAG: 1-acyl-sn-glycerol-3-phosphate acyltransferase [Prolixibacteraceae bacterium]|jgi:hypothetical protein|nr:1-acyl-sn-glycerol-3-phosphate acyltransferase [Prolixibacteraceae bacterium]
MSNFDDIRPFNNDEIKQALSELVADQMFVSVVGKLYPQPGATEKVLESIRHIDSVELFQEKIILPLLLQIEKQTTNGISYSAMDQFHPEERYLFISNHRDIILDSAFLNVVMHFNNFRKTEIAIGNNLLILDWISKLVRVNRAFIVKRNLGIREQLSASKDLSAYIRYALNQKGESVWIAQREGRTKDGDDKTQPALLKMLNMSSDGSIVDGFKALNIVPMSISYEIEPCGISKVEELLNRKYKPDFAKTPQDDLSSMANGVMQAKGRVHFGFGNPLNIRIDELTNGKNNNEIIQAIADYIDKRIYANYRLWPNNYIAADLLQQSQKYSVNYTDAQKQSFIERMDSEAKTLSFEYDEVIDAYLKMYANPVLNYAAHFEI